MFSDRNRWCKILADRSPIGMLMPSAQGRRKSWPGSRFSSGSAFGRPIMGVRSETLQRVKRHGFPFGKAGKSLLAVDSTRRPSQDSASADAELDR